MSTAVKREDNLIQVKQYITDKKGHKVAAIIEIDELERLKEILEGLPDLNVNVIEDKKNEPGALAEMIVKKAKGFRSVKPIHGKGTPASKLLIEADGDTLLSQRQRMGKTLLPGGWHIMGSRHLFLPADNNLCNSWHDRGNGNLIPKMQGTGDNHFSV